MIVASDLNPHETQALKKVVRPTGGASMSIKDLEAAVHALYLKANDPDLPVRERERYRELQLIEEMRLASKKRVSRANPWPGWLRALLGVGE